MCWFFFFFYTNHWFFHNVSPGGRVQCFSEEWQLFFCASHIHCLYFVCFKVRLKCRLEKIPKLLSRGSSCLWLEAVSSRKVHKLVWKLHYSWVQVFKWTCHLEEDCIFRHSEILYFISYMDIHISILYIYMRWSCIGMFKDSTCLLVSFHSFMKS